MNTATLRVKKGDGMGTRFMSVVRDSDGRELASIRYDPTSQASVRAMDEALADIAKRYGIEEYRE